MPRTKYAHRHPAGPPAITAAMPPTRMGEAALNTRPTPGVGGVHPAAGGDRVGVGEQGAVDRDRVGLADAGEEASDEEVEGVDGSAGQEREEAEREAGEADDRAASHPVGQPSHRAGAEHEERHRRGGDERDRAVGDVERLGDVGAEDVDRRLFEFVERVEDQQHHEGEEATLAEALLERHLLAADAGEEVVGEQDVFGPARPALAWRAASSSRTAAVNADADVRPLRFVSSLTRPHVRSWIPFARRLGRPARRL